MFLPRHSSCYSWLWFVLLAYQLPSMSLSFQPLPSTLQTRSPVFPRACPAACSAAVTCLRAVSMRQTFVYDGAELANFLLNMKDGDVASPRGAPASVGCMTLVVGTTVPNEGDGGNGRPQRIVGVERAQGGGLPEALSLGDAAVFTHTVAEVPNSISDADALSTAAAAAVGIHCSIPKVVEIGGGSSESDVFYSGKAVVLGGNEYACFVADGLASLGIDVSLVSTGGVKVNNKQVKAMQPSTEDDENEPVGFCTAIGRFDTLVDTIYDERGAAIASIGNSDDDRGPSFGPSGVMQLLAKNHQCMKYVSTLTKSQQIIEDKGVIFGPGKANSLAKSLESLSPSRCTQLIPSAGFGPTTVTTLFQKGVVFPSKNKQKSVVARGWSIKDFWEYTSWPRDSSSGTGVRFGLPVIDDEPNLDEEFQMDQRLLERNVIEQQENDKDLNEEEKEIVQDNPYVTKINDVEGLTDTIISKRRNGVIFVAMRSCRTCKSFDSPFTRIARECKGDFTFAKADATGNVGRQLGKQLGVVAVPSFVLFRDGKRYGAVSASRLPSGKLTKAMDDLASGKDFDKTLEDNE